MIEYHLIVNIRHTNLYQTLKKDSLDKMDFYTTTTFKNKESLIEKYQKEIDVFLENNESNIPPSATLKKYKHPFNIKIFAIKDKKIISQKRVLYGESKLLFCELMYNKDVLKRIISHENMIKKDILSQQLNEIINTNNIPDEYSNSIGEWLENSVKYKNYFTYMRLFLNVAKQLEQENTYNTENTFSNNKMYLKKG